MTPLSLGAIARLHAKPLPIRTGLAAAFLGIAVGALFGFGPTSASAQAAIPTMTRAEIIARAESALGTDYTWGQESWTPDTASGDGPDCSGLGLKCWEVPKTLYYQEENGENATISPRYTSYQFYNCQGPWYELSSRSLLREGDILVKNNGTSGHVTIYAGGDAWNSPTDLRGPGDRAGGPEDQPISRKRIQADPPRIAYRFRHSPRQSYCQERRRHRRRRQLDTFHECPRLLRRRLPGARPHVGHRVGAVDAAVPLHRLLRDLSALDKRDGPRLVDPGDGEHSCRPVQAVHHSAHQRVPLVLARAILVPGRLRPCDRRDHRVRDRSRRVRSCRFGHVRPGRVRVGKGEGTKGTAEQDRARLTAGPVAFSILGRG